VLTIVAAKGSLLVSLTSVTPIASHRVMMYTTSIVTLLWGLSAVFLIAFQCPSPQRWDITNPNCMDLVSRTNIAVSLALHANMVQRAVRSYNALMNIVTDLALAIVPTLMVLPLQITPEKRFTLITGFWSRIA
jgi:hypothetical protein